MMCVQIISRENNSVPEILLCLLTSVRLSVRLEKLKLFEVTIHTLPHLKCIRLDSCD